MGQMKKKKNHVSSRLNVLFFVVFILFSALILKLGIVQIVQGEEYVKQLERTSNVTARIDAPRGLMYDRNGNIVVDNELELSLTYTNRRGVTNEEKLEVAEKLETMVDIDTSKVTERDMKDFWIITREEEANEKVSIEERREIDDVMEEYQLTLDRITDEELAEISEREMRVLAIKREMDRGYALSPQRIKQGITTEEAHVVSEHLAELPGVDILRDSTRDYVYGDSFPTFFGNTGQIHRDKLDYYLSRGYERSDIVGTSFLELQYEDVLRGQKAVVESVTNSSGTTIGSPNEELGQRGYDLVLTIDMALQQQVEEIIRQEVDRAGGSFLADKDAYAVVLDPKTGELLSIAGYNDHYGTVGNAFEMGSTVKAATVLAGFETGVVQPGTVVNDRPLTLPGGITKRSWRSFGYINDLKALEVSSNIFMFEIAMRLANSNGSRFITADVREAYDQMRYYYSQFGLGVQTGVDLPVDSPGLNGGYGDPGKLLDLGIGQFDTYTPLQLAQFIATIANDGYRMQPRLVKEIREPSASKEDLGRVIHQFEPTVLNRIDMSDEHIQRVQEGLRRVMQGSEGTARQYFANRSYNPAGKTGTAQVTVHRTNDGNNQTLVGYAPFDDPEVAFAVIVPGVQSRGGQSGIANRIGQGILDAYFDLQR
ncbi:peptidoglycan D,D-transpeptidase FtsI family protein [Desertibacillus haloalkaliphilus]|uniref:peptidoglycan D,D-transpeptidase FtsI family protein n=1 Tax=Desertibacillus haloalkaliphilus TaxID=1328930 RepID=UPI001C26927E|nr:penicillin-binding protein 2 [Desertibacillus haloalkaliphilus]MBU8905715.1 penicillin-binding protein 2 [Desertibacillus haloalkaliphilus]